MTAPPSPRGRVLFAGGGSGGHIYPNAAIAERLARSRIDPVFIVSRRPIDATVCAALPTPDWVPTSAEPIALRPDRLYRWYRAHQAAVAECLDAIDRTEARAVVSTGGFVGGPAVEAAAQRGLPACLINLDAVPGKANRWSARKVDAIFTAYDHTGLPRARHVGVPLRQASLATVKPAAARHRLGLQPDRPTLLITAGSQGAATINGAMVELVSRTVAKRALTGWDVIHLTGSAPGELDRVAAAYRPLGINAYVEPFLSDMGLAWSAATLAICRAGAGTVAEAWASQTPSIFLPYPHHRDQHQRHNAEPLVRAGGALLAEDHVDPVATVGGLLGRIAELLSNQARRDAMQACLQRTQPPDGAVAVAEWVMAVAGRASGA
ncbi:MAG: UDP-N-acetylglucosamine--N-acetylmuramyl-(pentapeptide) pyrophosphoryl-undecaprenol N-acetylglucosamine transferase [Planctomycetota bacterium]